MADDLLLILAIAASSCYDEYQLDTDAQPRPGALHPCGTDAVTEQATGFLLSASAR